MDLEGVGILCDIYKARYREEDGTTMNLRSKHDICGGEAWKKVLEWNSMSFEQVHGKLKDSNVSAIDKKRKDLHKQAASSFGL